MIVGLRVLAAARLGDLVHNFSAALTSDGVFVFNLLIKSVIEPSSSRVELANCGMRGASWDSVVKFHHQLRSVVDERRCPAQGVSDDRSTGRRTTLFQTLRTTFFLYSRLLSSSTNFSWLLCFATTRWTLRSRSSRFAHRALSVCRRCLSALWDLDLRFHRCQWAHHSLRVLCSSSMLSGTVTFRACRLARSTRSRHRPSCPPVSQTVSSRLLCSTLSTLEPVAGVTVVAVSNVMRLRFVVFPASSRLAITIFISFSPAGRSY